MCQSQTTVGVSILLISIRIEKWARFLVCTLFRVKLHCSQMTHDAPYKYDTTHMTQMNNRKSKKPQSRTGNRVYLRTAQAQRERYQNACVLCAMDLFFLLLFGHLSSPVICSNWIYSFTRHSSRLYSYFIKCVTISCNIYLSFLWAQLVDGRSSDSISCYARAKHVQCGCSSFIRDAADVRKLKKATS